MRLMIDTNVVLDVLVRRQPFYDSSKTILSLCEDKIAQGFVSAAAITDIFYLVRKAFGNVDDAYCLIESLLNIVGVLTVTGDDVSKAFQVKARDFEDCLVATCAKSNGCNAIVTRNKRDYQNFGVTVYTPDELLQLLKE